MHPAALRTLALGAVLSLSLAASCQQPSKLFLDSPPTARS